MTEDERAVEYRRQVVARAAAKRAREAALAGDPAALAALKASWQPFTDARAEERASWRC